MNTRRKALTVLTLALVFAALVDRPARTGDYHYAQNLKCSDCHVSHASLSHDDNGLTLSGPMDPNRYLTKGASATATCLMCHDNTAGIPDVVGADINNRSEVYDGNERAGGQFSELNGNNWKGHTLPGQGPKSAGECTECHDPHGNENYRNLRALDGSPAGPIAFVNPLSKGLDRYRQKNIGYVKYMGDRLCIRCHATSTPGNMLAAGQAGRYQRHPSSSEDMIVGFNGPRADGRHWAEGTGNGFEVNGKTVPRVPFAVSTATSFAHATMVSDQNEVFCLSCHKAHGSVHAFSMQWDYGDPDGVAGAAGCNQCHNVKDQ